MAKQNSLSVPTGVKVISVLYYIGAALSVILAILAFVASAFIGTLLEAAGIPGMAALGAGVAIFVGVLMLAIAVLGFFVGRGLWNARNWARIVAIILAVIGFILAVISLVQGQFGNIVSLVVNGVIGGYLWFSSSVKSAFA
jgi:uncharacterized membrane protein (DUF2068 family)